MSAWQAKKQFKENLDMFYLKDTEKHNLYAGLCNLSDELSDLSSKLDAILKKL